MDKIYDGQTLPFGDGEFDSVLCTEVLEHCLNPQQVMREMARVLRPGGHALITVPMVIHHHEEPWDFQRFTRYGMEQLAAQAQLKVLWIQSRGGIYTVALATFYCALGFTLSRRPFIDILLWVLWPVALLVLWYEHWRNRPIIMSLGWQMLVQK